MTTNTVSVFVRPWSSSGDPAVPSAPITNGPSRVAEVPAAQAYYWTYDWQVKQAEAERELADGLGVEFADTSSALEWLASDE